MTGQEQKIIVGQSRFGLQQLFDPETIKTML